MRRESEGASPRYSWISTPPDSAGNDPGSSRSTSVARSQHAFLRPTPSKFEPDSPVHGGLTGHGSAASRQEVRTCRSPRALTWSRSHSRWSAQLRWRFGGHTCHHHSTVPPAVLIGYATQDRSRSQREPVTGVNTLCGVDASQRRRLGSAVRCRRSQRVGVYFIIHLTAATQE
jgi:hypothetical protein